MHVLFATSNQNKVKEANKVSSKYNISLTQVNILYPEVRSDSVREVAEEGVKYVHKQINRSIIVEDSGLFIDALNGFPGAYSALVYKKIGLDGVLKLMEGVVDREAKFISAIGYCDKNNLRVFEGVVDGFILTSKHGTHGFGYDPIFKPRGYTKTFAEDIKLKNEISHRRKATEMLCRYLKTL